MNKLNKKIGLMCLVLIIALLTLISCNINKNAITGFAVLDENATNETITTDTTTTDLTTNQTTPTTNETTTTETAITNETINESTTTTGITANETAAEIPKENEKPEKEAKPEEKPKPAEPNKPPVWKSDVNEFIVRGTTAIDLSDHFFDENNDTISYTATTPEKISATIDNNIATLIPDGNNFTTTIEFTASDGDKSTSKEVTLIVPERAISINLQYNPGTIYDADDNGYEATEGIIDFTVESSKFTWGANESNLCTRWNVYSVEDAKSTTVCYGSEKCCSFIGLAPTREAWDDEFYSTYGQYGATFNNIVSAQVIYVDYGKREEKPFVEIYYSGWQNLSAGYYLASIDFENVCVETCTLSNFNETSYKLIFEIDNAVLNLDMLTYSIAEEISKVLVNLEVKDDEGFASGSYELYKNSTLISATEGFVEPDYYDIEVLPKENIIDKLLIENANIIKPLTASIGIDNVTREISIENVDVKKRYAVDLEEIEFEKATLQATASANALYKCRQWDYDSEVCFGAWEKVKDLTLGEAYNITLTKDDPGFIEGDTNITVAPINITNITGLALIKDIPDITIAVNTTVDLSQYFSNIDGNTVFTYLKQDGITILFENGLATIVPDKDFIGTVYTYITATQNGDSVISNLFSITVTSMSDLVFNLAFVNDIPNISIITNKNATIYLTDHYTGIDNQPIFTYYKPDGVTILIDKSTLTIVPDKDFVGTVYTFITGVEQNISVVSNVFSISVVNITEDIVPTLIPRKKDFKLDEDVDIDFEYLTKYELIEHNKWKDEYEVYEEETEKTEQELEQLKQKIIKKVSQKKKWQAANESIEAFVYDYNLHLTDIEPEIEELREGKFNLKLKKPRAFKAGRYTLKLELIKDGVIFIQKQDFTWGVLAINVNKSIYLPNEDAFIGIGVLDDRGKIVCDADVTLEIINPLNEKTILTTANNDIKISPECQVLGVTELPDYYTSYSVNGVGTYAMNLTAVTANGVRSIQDDFTVQSSVSFDVARQGPTRVYPAVPYRMEFTINANEDYSGPIIEYVPSSFAITPQQDIIVNSIGDEKAIIWILDLAKGKTYNIGYEFDAPDISPEFYVLGPLEIGAFKEARQWQIANDVYGNVKFFDMFTDLTQWSEDIQGDWGTEAGTGACAGLGCTGGGACMTGKDAGSNMSTASNIDLSDCTLGTGRANWTQGEAGTLEAGDCLNFTWSTDGGSTWDPIGGNGGFCDDAPKAANGFVIPDAALVSTFRWRWVCNDFGQGSGGGNEQGNIIMFNITCDVADTTKPRINASLNNLSSDFLQGNNVNMTANVTDETGLSFCQFIDNQSLPNGAKTYFNFSFPASTTSSMCSQNYTIALATGAVINFTVVVNDTTNNKNQSEQIVTVQAAPDNTRPRINASLNNLSSDFVQGNRVNMTANVTDETGLNFCQFIDNQSLANGAKTYFNFSFPAGTTSSMCSQNYTIALSAGNVINFTVIVNDTSTATAGGNINQSVNRSDAGAYVIGQIITVLDLIPPIVNTTFNVTSPLVNDVINFTGNITDETGLLSANITYNISGVITKANYTLSSTSAQVSNVTNFSSCVETCAINFTMYATDTSNNVKQNSTLIVVADVTKPVVNTTLNKSLSSIFENDIINISANITDGVRLLSANITYNMSAVTDGPGILTKVNFTSLSGTTAQVSNVTQITCGAGCVINFTVYATDTSNNVKQNSTLITVASAANPPIIKVNNATGFAVDPIAGGNSIVLISFNVTDAQGVSDINATKAVVNFTLGYESGQWRSNVSDIGAEFGTCFNHTEPGPGAELARVIINCTVLMRYYDNASAWFINISVADISGAVGLNATQSFTYNTLSAISLPYTAINFSSVFLGQQDVLAYPHLLINNTGNEDLDMINMTAAALVGTTTTTENIAVTNFGVNLTNSSTNLRLSFPSDGIVNLKDPATGGNASLIHGHTSAYSVIADKGNISAFIWVNVPSSGLSSQLYNATWNVTAVNNP